MTKSLGNYHYEFIEARGKGHQWRVGDQDDDMVTDFATKEEARPYVEEHNRRVSEQNADRMAENE